MMRCTCDPYERLEYDSYVDVNSCECCSNCTGQLVVARSNIRMIIFWMACAAFAAGLSTYWWIPAHPRAPMHRVQ